MDEREIGGCIMLVGSIAAAFLILGILVVLAWRASQ